MSCRRRLLAVAALVHLAGCGFDGGFEAGYQCGVDGWCPPGQTCVDGFCASDPSSSPDAEPGTIDASPDGATPVARCGTLTLVQDDFEDGVIGRLWDTFSGAGAVASENGGEAVIALTQGTADVWAGFESDALYDFTDGVLEVEVVGVGGIYTLIEINAFGPGLAQMYVETGQLTAAVLETAGAGVRAQTDYQAADHRYWRLRESGGTLFWELSADRVAWTALHSEPMPFPGEHVRAYLSAGGQLAAGPSEARFGDVNLDAPEGLVYCPASQLVDTFDDGGAGPNWSRYLSAGCTAIESGGSFNLAYEGTGDAYCGIDSLHWWDLRGSSVTLDAGGVPGGSDFYAYFQVGRPEDGDTRQEIERQGNLLDIEQQLDGVESGALQLAYDAVAHRWWRIRESGGEVFFETAPDGATWTARSTIEAAFDLSMVEVEIGAGHDAPGPGVPLTWVLPGVN